MYAVYKEKLQHLALRETKLKLRTYTVPVLEVVDVTVEHNGQEKIATVSFQEIVWLKKIRLNWQEVFVVMDGDTWTQETLKKHSKVCNGEHGSMKDIVVKLKIKPHQSALTLVYC